VTNPDLFVYKNTPPFPQPRRIPFLNTFTRECIHVHMYGYPQIGLSAYCKSLKLCVVILIIQLNQLNRIFGPFNFSKYQINLNMLHECTYMHKYIVHVHVWLFLRIVQFN